MLYPDFQELLQLGRRAGKMKSGASRPVLSIVSGDQRSPFRGRGLEFEEVREYVQGDDVRNIDWRVTARTGRPHLKLFAEERERSVLVCVDVNKTMRFGTRGTFKSIQAARAAALIGWSASGGNNRVGGSVFGHVPGGMQFYAPVRSRRSLWRMLKQLCAREEYGAAYVALEDHLRYLVKAAPSGSLVFIISDFMVFSETLKKRLSDLHRHCDVVLVCVNDPADENLPSVGAVEFSSDLSDTLRINSDDIRGAAAYREYWRKNRDDLGAMARGLGLGVITVKTNGDVTGDVLNGLKRLGRKGGHGYGRSALATA